ncbi:hypothetical protein [Streptococcus merionis]|uniref:hypothetical protein n=1 Tax=Streptococcus merionis TaxID=400065 RepID=UPI0035194ACB
MKKLLSLLVLATVLLVGCTSAKQHTSKTYENKENYIKTITTDEKDNISATIYEQSGELLLSFQGRLVPSASSKIYRLDDSTLRIVVTVSRLRDAKGVMEPIYQYLEKVDSDVWDSYTLEQFKEAVVKGMAVAGLESSSKELQQVEALLANIKEEDDKFVFTIEREFFEFVGASNLGMSSWTVERLSEDKIRLNIGESDIYNQSTEAEYTLVEK